MTARGGATRRRVRLTGATIVAPATLVILAAALLAPTVALAHPLGNFTINHFAALRIASDRISIDVVIDRAEIPAYQEQQRLDTDRSGALSGAELAGQAEAGCRALLSDLRLAVGSAPAPVTLIAAGLSMPPGAGGLPTLRLVCQLEAPLATPIDAQTTVAFEDRSFAERIGWREIVVLGDRLLVDGRPSDTGDGGGASARLTAYPADLLARPLDMRSVEVVVAPGGVALPAWNAPDAQPIDLGGGPASSGGQGALGGAPIPGGIAENLATIVDVDDLSPLAILLSLAVALGLGVVHALSPGHGKTIMAAYLVGSGGSTRQAIGLGLAVATSHTLGVLALALVTLAASSVLPPERLYPILGVVSGGLVVAIGASLLWARLRPLLRAAAHDRAHRHGHAHEHGHAHAHGHSFEHGHLHPHAHPDPHGHSDRGVSWRGMLALGLSGGLVPSASALILLLGSIATGRVAYGLVLVLGFGLGMALVLGGLGLAVVHGRALIERRSPSTALRRLAGPVQVGTASLVVVLGAVLTGQALTQVL